MGIWQFRYVFLYRLIPLCYYLLRFYLSLLRVKVVGEEIALGCLTDYGKIIVAVWHQRFLPALAYVTKFRNFKPIVMISQSKDGDLAAWLAERLGLVPVRGSSTRGGATALSAILKSLKSNQAVIHIVDGPTGPKGVVKPGLISMARMSGAVILPVLVSVDRAWIMGSWDRFLVPKPFSKVTIEWGPPLAVPRDLDQAGDEEFRAEIQKRLAEGYAQADLSAGWKHPL
ncbi:MAG: lysophospholipid acyltransferase family protein [Thermodesulfobacteriota bacterium]